MILSKQQNNFTIMVKTRRNVGVKWVKILTPTPLTPRSYGECTEGHVKMLNIGTLASLYSYKTSD
jgi:hypothetical protein